jgi:Protein kinase domain
VPPVGLADTVGQRKYREQRMAEHYYRKKNFDQTYQPPLPHVIVPSAGLVDTVGQRNYRNQKVVHYYKPRQNRRHPHQALGSHGPLTERPTIVTGLGGYWPWIRSWGIEPSKASVFFVHFYLVSLGAALSVLFFRAWFFFPLSFLSDDHDIYVTAEGIRRTTLKNWFLSVLTINRWAIGGGPDSLRWSEVRSLSYLEEGYTKLCPLPETAFKKESLTYKLLNKLAAFFDGLTKKMNTGNYLVFSTAQSPGEIGRNLKLSLNELNREQKARLFYAVKNWAPHISIKSSAEEQLLGSTVLQDVRYTQLWFDILTSKTLVKKQSTLTSGETLKNGLYTIEERLTSGGQATAYLASNASGSKYVLKEFILAISSSPGALVESAREFETEVTLLSQLNHPGIVHLEDFFTEDGRVYVVLEYVQGQTLRQKVQQDGPLGEVEVAKLTQSVCDVLEYLHNFDPPIVHRDVTPENILVLPDGTIKLIDFGLAIKSDGRSTTDSCGKQAFTPPEQFQEEICPQSDIYALGATMYFMLTGLAPKPITTSSPAAKAPHISTKINAIVERATQLDLGQRYESVHWMKLDLADALRAEIEQGAHLS